MYHHVRVVGITQLWVLLLLLFFLLDYKNTRGPIYISSKPYYIIKTLIYTTSLIGNAVMY